MVQKADWDAMASRVLPAPPRPASAGRTAAGGTPGGGLLGMRALASFMSPASTFTGEKLRGALSSVVSGLAAGGLNWAGVAAMGLSPETSAACFLYAFGSIFGYTLDILFAKRDFRLPGSTAIVPLPYTALRARAAWLARSFVRKQFFRYLVTVLIDTIVGIALLKAILDHLDRRGVWTAPPKRRALRDALVSSLVAIFTFVLYVNILRFDWAYRDGDDPVMNVVVLMWSTLVLVMYALARWTRSACRPEALSAHEAPAHEAPAHKAPAHKAPAEEEA